MRTKLILVSLLLSSCSYLSVPVLSPYKMDIRQGNLITPEMREKLKLGMSKAQVKFVMGTPMVSDAFHADRWDYAYSLERRGEVVEKQHYKLTFAGDQLVSIDDGKTVETMPVVTPEPVVAEVAAPVADPAAEVLGSVQAWATAWAGKNTQGYLASYSADFKPQGMSRAAWEKQRAERINRPKVIEVKLSSRNVSIQDEQHATVSFIQDYRSDAYHDQVEKTLELVKQGDQWLITDERVGQPVKNPVKGVFVSQAKNVAEQSVQVAIKLWAEAWSARDAAQYLSSYAADFAPAGMSRAAWEAQRKARLSKTNSIAVEVSEMNVKFSDDHHASATFKQDYRSDSYHDNTRKTLQLEKFGEAWMIVSEQAVK